MKSINFQTGGFPGTTDTFDYLQDATLEVLNAWISKLNLRPGVNYILGGCVIDGSTVTDGWMYISGELVQYTGGAGLYVSVTEDITAVTYEDTVSKNSYFWKKAAATATATGNIAISTFKRLRNHEVFNRAACTNLSGRVFKLQLERSTNSIMLDSEGVFTTNGGFIVNHIEPFEGIEHGHELLVRLGDGTGLTYLTKGGVVSNLFFNIAEYNDGGTSPILRPCFDSQYFIGSYGSSYASLPTPLGVRYDWNVHFKFYWHADLQAWIEMTRFSLNNNSI